MKKHNFIFIALSFMIATICMAQTDDSDVSPVVQESLWTSVTKPFFKARAWLKEGAEELAQDTLNNKDIKRAESDLRNYVLSYEQLNNSIGKTIKDLEDSPFNLTIPLSVWEEYVASICKEELANIPIDLPGIKRFKERSDANLMNSEENISSSTLFIKKVLEQCTLNVSEKASRWEHNQSCYNELKTYFYPPVYPWYKKAARWTGYAAVALLGPYTGYKIYQKLLAHYFNRPGITKEQIQKEITALRFEVDRKLQNMELAVSIQIKKSLQKAIERLEQSIEKLESELITPRKPSKLRKTTGVAIQISIMALTTYLFYTLFKKFDDYYLAPQVHAAVYDIDASSESFFDASDIETVLNNGVEFFEPQEMSKDAQDMFTRRLFQSLKQEKYDLTSARHVLEQFEKILRDLGEKGDKKERLSYIIMHLKSSIKERIHLSERLDESAQYLEKMKAQAIMEVLFPLKI